MIRLILFLLISASALGAPKEIEVWFLSNTKAALLQELLNRPQYVYRSHTAELQCQEVGDFCFDPQHGLYKKNDATFESVETKVVEKAGPSIPAAKSLERDLISCDPNNYFDIFCGKSKKQTSTDFKLDLWIDTSSSMREFDFQDKAGECFRKSFMKVVDNTCGFNEKVNVMMFDTSIKQAGSIDQLCNNQGLNDYKRLMDWIERSDAKKLVVVTDIYELHREFSDYIESKNGKLRGDKDPLTGKQMLELADELAKSCK